MSHWQSISPRTTDVGGIPVARVLPVKERRTIGPWCFLDHIGPAEFAPGERGLDVGPHPHIRLQTFTWMIEGEILHKDSLGSLQLIRPGQVNLMSAGHGIVHTEESVPDTARLHAAQLWLVLPPEQEEMAPRFDHYPTLPRWQEQGAELTLLIGEHDGQQAPTLAFSPLIGLDIHAPAGARLTLPLNVHFEHGLFPLEGSVTIDGTPLAAEHLAYLAPEQQSVEVQLAPGARLLLIGGEPLALEPTIWWNFVSRDRAAIIQADEEWRSGSRRFGPVPGYDGARLISPPLPWK
ncbi:pirin family protein [Aeromonas simiae]|uniref:pirin family protein n=1 Tax=Aeromonas simiae TaxID=218936 RepID=UPI0005A9D078|nr:pirin family protein [Aeromonas simiae]MDO2948023.1 pirin family protein [Aeromonas simiae]MDO2952274.1 pirin family protein [Aeromonas simiae]MDO2955406.1 pirin family protein [Aeromonas simiae]